MSVSYDLKAKHQETAERPAEEHTISRHGLINMSVPKFPKIELEPAEHPKIGKHLMSEQQ